MRRRGGVDMITETMAAVGVVGIVLSIFVYRNAGFIASLAFFVNGVLLFPLTIPVFIALGIVVYSIFMMVRKRQKR